MAVETFTSLADLPTVDSVPAEPEAEAPPPRSTIQIAKVGRFTHPRYGAFKITQDTFDSFMANFAAVSGGELPIDVDHAPERGGPTEAYGWIRAMRREGDTLLADVDWTWRGAALVADRAYRYISPTWSLTYKSDDGTARGPTLLGAALTNRAFFERMRPCVLLSQSFARDDAAFAVEEPPSDSRPAMDKDELIEVFGLDADASEEDVLTAARQAKEAAEKPEEPAVPEGQVLVNAEEFAQLQTGVNAGQKAAQDLAEMRFSAAFSKAVTEGRVAPAQEDNFRKIFHSDEELGVTTLDALQPIVSTGPAGRSGSGQPDIPEGYDADSVKLDRQVQAYMAEHKVQDYSAALESVLASQERVVV